MTSAMIRLNKSFSLAATICVSVWFWAKPLTMISLEHQKIDKRRKFWQRNVNKCNENKITSTETNNSAAGLTHQAEREHKLLSVDIVFGIGTKLISPNSQRGWHDCVVVHLKQIFPSHCENAFSAENEWFHFIFLFCHRLLFFSLSLLLISNFHFE